MQYIVELSEKEHDLILEMLGSEWLIPMALDNVSGTVVDYGGVESKEQEVASDCC